MKVAVDTDVLWAFFMKDKAAAELIDAQSTVYVPAPVYGELLAALRNDSPYAQNVTQLNAFMEDSAVEVLQIGPETAEYYARIYQDLPSHYLWVAALCLEHGCELATHDQNFKQIPQLTLC